MSKIRVLSDQLANQIAAGEVVERPASVAKELVENAIDSGALRIQVDVEAGGRRLLRVIDDGEGMTRDDAVLAFERHATSKISDAADLNAIGTLGFRGEALASIAAVARVELVTKTESAPTATRVLIEGGRMREVKDAAHPKGTTLTVRDLFFNVPARRKFLRSEATESFHLTNLVTHYALAHPEIAFTLSNNGRESLRVAPAGDLRERVYQIFGREFLDNLLEVNGGLAQVAISRGFVSAPRERRSSRDTQYLFINGRYVRDRLVSRAVSEAYRTVLPNGVYPAALLFLEVPLEEVDVNVHPAKTEVRFRRASAVADSVRDAVRSTLVSAGYVRASVSANEERGQNVEIRRPVAQDRDVTSRASSISEDTNLASVPSLGSQVFSGDTHQGEPVLPPADSQQEKIKFGLANPSEQHLSNGGEIESLISDDKLELTSSVERNRGERKSPDHLYSQSELSSRALKTSSATCEPKSDLPPLVSAANLVREVPVESLSRDLRVLGQLDESYIVACDDEGLLLIGQHVAHERILFDKYHALEESRRVESQNLLIPETFDLTPSQAIALDVALDELERYGFGLMRLSGRTVAIKAVPSELPMGEARKMLSEILESISGERRGSAHEALRDQIAASLACHAAVKSHTPLAPEKMAWLINRLLNTTSPTTCPHGRPVILRLATRDIEKGFHRS
jgi:DNA mismatch repair protein MutL